MTGDLGVHGNRVDAHLIGQLSKGTIRVLVPRPDWLDLATRRELDEVYREIHELKREVRALRSPAPPAPMGAAKLGSRSGRRKSK